MSALLPVCCRDTIRTRMPGVVTDGAEIICRHCLALLQVHQGVWRDKDYDEWIAREREKRMNDADHSDRR